MAFKSLTQYQEDKNGEFFVLPNDGDFADVIFLYRNINDVLVADVHYIASSGYKGYVHCCGAGCPACNYGERGIRLDTKLFIPLYNLQKNKIEFWDRSTFFEQTLQKYVFAPFPTPWETVFRVTRRGEARSRDTKYDIVPVGRNTTMTYDSILSSFGITLPAGYSAVCREMSAAEMSAALNSAPSSNSDLQDYGYTPIPRGTSMPDVTVPTPQYSAPPEVAPPVMPEYTPDLPPVEMPAVTPVVANESVPAIDPVTISNEVASDTDDSGDPLDDVKF